MNCFILFKVTWNGYSTDDYRKDFASNTYSCHQYSPNVSTERTKIILCKEQIKNLELNKRKMFI